MKNLVKRSLPAILTIALCMPVIAQRGQESHDNASASAPARKLPLDQALKAAATYQYGQGRECLSDVEDYVRAAANSPAARADLAAKLEPMLLSGATLDCKRFACRQMVMLGGPANVPTLAKLLLDNDLSDMARYALQAIPGPEARDALIAALGRATDSQKIGIVNTLGERGDPAAVPELDKLASSANPKVAEAALGALGRIGGPESASLLKARVPKVNPGLKSAACNAYLACAESLLAAGNREAALEIYGTLFSSSEASPIRVAGLRGIAAAAPKRAIPDVVRLLSGDDPEWKAACIQMAREIEGSESTKALCAASASPDPELQRLLLIALGDRGDAQALPCVAAGVKSASEGVRIAALGAMGQLGGKDQAAELAAIAASSSGFVKDAARAALSRIKGKDVDQTILAQMETANPEVKAELVRGLGARHSVAAIPAVMKSASDQNAAVRQESLRALALLCGPAEMPGLVKLLVEADSAADREEAKKTVVAVARRVDDEAERSAAVLAALENEDDPQIRLALIETLGPIGGPRALEALRGFLNSEDPKLKDTAFRTLADLESDEHLEDMRRLAREGTDETQRILAFRSFVKAVGKDEFRPPQETFDLYYDGFRIAATFKGEGMTEGQRLILGGLANVPLPEALKIAVALSKRKGLEDEAISAALKIAESIADTHPQETRAAAKELLQQDLDEEVRNKANALLAPEAVERAKMLRQRSDAKSQDRDRRESHR